MKKSMTDVLELLGVVAIIVALVGAKGCYAQAVYGDWTCAFSKCVRVK